MPDRDLSPSTQHRCDFDRLVARYVDRLNDGEKQEKVHLAGTSRLMLRGAR